MVEITKIQDIVREAAKLFADRNAAEHIMEKGHCDYVTAVDEVVQSFVQEKCAGKKTDFFLLAYRRLSCYPFASKHLYRAQSF